MNIYEICEFETEDCEGDAKYYYLIHENKLSKEGFIKICEEGMSVIEDKSTYCLKEWLIDQRGFKEIHAQGKFDFT